MRDIFALALLVAVSPLAACKKNGDSAPPASAEENPEPLTAEEQAAMDRLPGEAEQLAMLDRAVECYEGGPPEDLDVKVIHNTAGEIESVKITPPPDAATHDCVLAKVKAKAKAQPLP